MLLISGNKGGFGNILNSNHELEQILGYKRKDIIGQNVSVLMPECISQHHNTFVKRYFERNFSQSSNLLVEQTVFAQHIQGHIILSHLLVSPLPYVTNGIQFLGFLAPAKTVGKVRLGQEYIKVKNVIHSLST